MKRQRRSSTAAGRGPTAARCSFCSPALAESVGWRRPPMAIRNTQRMAAAAPARTTAATLIFQRRAPGAGLGAHRRRSRPVPPQPCFPPSAHRPMAARTFACGNGTKPRPPAGEKRRFISAFPVTRTTLTGLNCCLQDRLQGAPGCPVVEATRRILAHAPALRNGAGHATTLTMKRRARQSQASCRRRAARAVLVKHGHRARRTGAAGHRDEATCAVLQQPLQQTHDSTMPSSAEHEYAGRRSRWSTALRCGVAPTTSRKNEPDAGQHQGADGDRRSEEYDHSDGSVDGAWGRTARTWLTEECKDATACPASRALQRRAIPEGDEHRYAISP